ncbi:hypothetical protein M406DRAFT_349714 [Cryphonectria parasitica EP155]|uniref:Protein kinase domain-containing protein n=1 Tax=Cryphonectria parasitica (strain ATCC 38755 / EP155) TaxID=660469 RepID=A0A9P4Y7R8_CRYP1|nr:uncharacterized protein M406DRAFT_349714 [Cryphonectria parasitica EP155]KAF3768298.1 hypothetical protein M406DRAFT_349714 [Cryphonectria parasitica EP155]
MNPPEGTDSLDLSQYLVMLGSFRIVTDNNTVAEKSVKAIADHNSEFRFDSTAHDNHSTDAWMGSNPREELWGPFFALPLEKMSKTSMPKNNSAYILGSLDPEEAELAGKSHPKQRAKDNCACDFELAENNQTGISRKTISIDLYPQPNANKQVMVRVGVLTERVRYATLDADPDAGWSTSHAVEKGKHFPVPQDGCLLITISRLQFRITSKSKSKPTATYLYMGTGAPTSILAKPPSPVLEVQVNKVVVYCALAPFLPYYPNVYNFVEVAVYAADDSRSKPNNLPWAIGDFVPDNTETLGTLLDLEAAGEDTLGPRERLFIFQQLCSAICHVHSHDMAHGGLTSREILIIPGAATENPITEKADDEAVVQTDPVCTVKVFGFTVSTLKYRNEEVVKAQKGDAVELGHLGVRLLAGCEKRLRTLSYKDKDAWIEASYGADYRVQPLLEYLIGGRLSSEHAKDWASGILIDKPGVSALAKRMEQRSAKRKWTESRLAPQESSKRQHTAQPMSGSTAVANGTRVIRIPKRKNAAAARAAAMLKPQTDRVERASAAQLRCVKPLSSNRKIVRPRAVRGQIRVSRASIANLRGSETHPPLRSSLKSGTRQARGTVGASVAWQEDLKPSSSKLGSQKGLEEVASPNAQSPNDQAARKSAQPVDSLSRSSGNLEVENYQTALSHTRAARQDFVDPVDEDDALSFDQKYASEEEQARQDAVPHKHVEVDDGTTASEASLNDKVAAEPSDLDLAQDDALSFDQVYASEEEQARQDAISPEVIEWEEGTTESESSLNGVDGAEPSDLDPMAASEVQSGHTSAILVGSEADSHDEAKLSSQLRPYMWGSSQNKESGKVEDDDDEVVDDEDYEFDPIVSGANKDVPLDSQYDDDLPDTQPWTNEPPVAEGEKPGAVSQLFEFEELQPADEEAREEDELSDSRAEQQIQDQTAGWNSWWTTKWMNRERKLGGIREEMQSAGNQSRRDGLLSGTTAHQKTHNSGLWLFR